MIVSFRHKGLKDLFRKGSGAHVPPELKERCKRRLDALDSAIALENLNLPGFDLHPLHTTPVRHSIHVNGSWCVTFRWENGAALKVDLEQYH
jgi:proteic killer suppression protein